jgi:hypothetical protein
MLPEGHIEAKKLPLCLTNYVLRHEDVTTEWRYSSTILNLLPQLHILSYLRVEFHGRVGSTAASHSGEAGFKYRPQRPLTPSETFRSLRQFYQTTTASFHIHF